MWRLCLLCCVGPVGLALSGPSLAQDTGELAFARSVLTELQEKSFVHGREYCGLIGYDAAGNLLASRPRRGRVASCRPRDSRTLVEVVASYHTHGGFDPDFTGELPSVDDILSDMEEGIDGYIATPGGRFWFVDGTRGTASQICGLACLPQDPAFEPGLDGPIPRYVTLDSLEAFFDE